MQIQRYNNVAILIHWASALLMIYMLFWGEDMIQGRNPENPALHVSLGILILVLSVIRLVWRLMNPPPADVPMPAWQAKASHALHWLFYALLIIIPLTGLGALHSEIVGRHPEFANLQVFGLFNVLNVNLGPIGGAHGLLTKLAIFLLIVHVVAALKHQFWDKDGLLRRMMPH